VAAGVPSSCYTLYLVDCTSFWLSIGTSFCERIPLCIGITCFECSCSTPSFATLDQHYLTPFFTSRNGDRNGDSDDDDHDPSKSVLTLCISFLSIPSMCLLDWLPLNAVQMERHSGLTSCKVWRAIGYQLERWTELRRASFQWSRQSVACLAMKN
jgi:hypothetical protein